MPLPPGYQLSQSGQQFVTNQNNSPFKPPSKEQIDLEKNNDPTKQWDWQNQDQTGPQGQALPELAIGWKPDGSADFGTGLSGFWNKAVSNVRSAWQRGYTEGLSISGATELAVTKVQGEAQGQQTLDKMAADRKPQDQNTAYWTASLEASKEIFNQALWGTLDALSLPATWTEQAIGTAGQTLGRALGGEEISTETIQKDWQASRLAYSSIFDSTVYAEMNRRIDSGIRPDLAAQEVMSQRKWSLWPELIGNVFFDPFNTLSIIGKEGQQIKLIANETKKFHDVANPHIAQMLEDLKDISKLDDATAYQKVSELVKSQQALTAAASHAEDITKAGKDIELLSQSYKLGSLTRDGKVAHLANQTGEILMHIVNNSSPDEALEILRGMVLSTSSDASKAAEGVSTMLHFADPAALFSEAGNNTTVMLSGIMEKYGDNWLENIAKLKDDPVALTKDLLGKLDSVGEEMFPSVSKMLEAEKAVKAGGEVIDTTRALAERAKNLPEYVKVATRFHDSAQKVVGPLNRFFVGAYMGWNPGFAFRNFSNNTTQLLIDYGPGVLLGKADNLLIDAEKLHGGILQGAFGFGQTADVLGLANKAEGATDVSGIVNAIKGKTTLKNGPAQILAGKFEENAAKRIIAKTYTQTFERGVKAMVRDLTPQLKASGFSDDIIKKLPTYIMQNNGDATQVINALRKDVSSGVIDVFNDISRIDPKYKAFLEDAGKFNEYSQTVLQASTREEATAAAKKIFDDIAQAGDYVYREGRPATDNYDKFYKAMEANGLSETRGQLISIRKTESRKAIQAAESILSEADDLGATMGLQVGTMKKARGISGLNTWGNDAAKEADRLCDLTNQISKDAKAGKLDFATAWKSNPELFPTPTPSVLDRQTFLDALWHNYDQVTSKVWGDARDVAISNVTGYLDDLKAAKVPVKDEWYQVIKDAQEGAQQYDKAMVGRFGELVEETPMAYGSRTSQINKIAAKNGIATATEAGLPTVKKTLSIINKYADVSYKSLEEVPISVAEEAFAKKAGKTATNDGLTQALDLVNKVDAENLAKKEHWMKWASENIPQTDEAWSSNIKPKETYSPPNQSNVRLVRTKEGDILQSVNGSTWHSPKVNDLLDWSKYENPELAHFDEAGKLVEPSRKRILPPHTDGELPPVSRAIHEQMDSVGTMRAWVMDDIAKNFGKKQVIDKALEGSLQSAEKQLSQRLAETRLISSRVAQANRDFTLLNYGEKTYGDVALAYLYPFHFWYKGTYTNWLKRVATNPSILAHYSHYKQDLSVVHAGMPKWWKNNINTNDLPGVNVDNPMFFNLEATLWPLNGLTGTDFNDTSKRVNFWTYALDYANKFGPSTWTPLNMVTGLALYAQGEKEAGEKWMGRLFPQSNVIKAGASLLGATNFETDPLVNALQGGLDPYERRRVGRALAAMQQDAQDGQLPYTKEQIMDAAYKQEGPIWDEAVKRAVNGRAGSTISSFLFGVGFKGRTEQDQQIDNFYSDYSKLWTMRPNITTEEFRQGMDKLKSKYSFMDTVLLSARDDVKRDSGLAYTVLTRIPPGKTTEIAKAVGVDSALLDKFFTDKGQIDQWSAADRTKFMSGVLTIAATLEIPSDETRTEWTKAKNAYTGLTNEAKQKFGETILDQVDGYYQAKTISPDAATSYLDKHPEVGNYMDWKAQRVMNSPLLSAYYGGASQIEGYYRSQMYNDIEKKLGKDIFNVISDYNDMKTFGDPGEASKFYSQHKAQIKQYYTIKDSWTYTINQETAKLSAQLPDGKGATIREDFDSTSLSSQNLASSLQNNQPTYADFQAQIPDRIMNIVSDYFFNGDKIPTSAEKQLGRLASEMGYSDTDALLQAIGESMYSQVP